MRELKPLLVLLTLAPGGGSLAAQTTEAAADRLRPPLPAGLLAPAPDPRGAHQAMGPDSAASPGTDASRLALYSLVLPGLGQLAQGQRRWLAYAALEGLAWVLHLDRRGSGHDLRDAYREIAWEVARDGAGPREVDDFEYYERLSRWATSGSWDADPESPGLQPETDPATYNGAVWARAAGIFLGGDPGVGPGDPRWEQALAYYEQRAYPPELLWSWQGQEAARDRFGRLLEESDDHLEEATLMIGVILANHVLSAADALVSARLRRATDGRVDAGLAWLPRGMRRGPASGALGLVLRIRP